MNNVNFAAWPDRALTPPEPHPFYERRYFQAFDFHRSRAEMRGLAELLDTLRGQRDEFNTWASSGMPTTYMPADLADEITNDLPANFIAQCLSVIESGDEALRLRLREQLTRQINKMVEQHAEFAAEHAAALDARGES